MTNMFNEIVKLNIKGFEQSCHDEPIGQLNFIDIDANEWFDDFIRQAVDSIGNKYFPVYRMADGEFIFCNELDTIEKKHCSNNLLNNLLSKVVHIIKSKSQTLRTCWGESYSDTELRKLAAAYPDYVREISRDGMLAMHFTRTKGGFSEEYFQPMCTWFDKHNILLNKNNYVSFYFVYALLRGPERKKVFQDRNVLIVSWIDDERKTALLHGLSTEGVNTVQFLPISPVKSMFEQIDLSAVKLPIDIALVGAGIGSANILRQLKPLNTLCIDAGFCIDCIANPTLGEKRAFCSPDKL